MLSWPFRRRYPALLTDCNHEMAKAVLAKQFAGAVIPKDLACLLDAYIVKPSAKTAAALVAREPELVAVFELARTGGFSEAAFSRGDLG